MGQRGKGKPSGRALAGVLTAVLALAALTVGPTLIAGGDDEALAGSPYVVTVVVTGNGVVSAPASMSGAVPNPTPIDCGSAGGPGCSATYYFGENITLHATPAGADSFTGWSGGDCVPAVGTPRDCTITNLNGAKTVNATFTGAVPVATPTPGAAPTPTPNPTPAPNLSAALGVALKACKQIESKNKRKKCIKRVKRALSG